MKDITKNTDQKLQEKIDELENQAQEFEERYKRALADYQNLEKRSRLEKSEWIKQASQNVILKLLPLLDTLELALKHEANQTLRVMQRQFVDILNQEGVEKIDTKDKKFDVNTMECLETDQSGDEVIEEVRSGYNLNGSLLRPAQVKVGKRENN